LKHFAEKSKSVSFFQVICHMIKIKIKTHGNSMPEEIKQQENPNWQFRFFTIWIGQSFSMLGSHLVGFAFVWYLTEQTGSATILTLGTLVQVLPSVVIGPFAGALVDRWNRKVVMAVFDSITALFTLFVALMFVFDSAQIWHIMLAMFVRSACGQFQWAAMTASTTLMVPKRHLSRVAGANQTLQGIMSILGPALGAFLIAALPMQGVLFIDVSTAIFAVLPLLFFTIPRPVRNGTKAAPKSHGKTSLFQDLKEGWKYVTGWPALMAIILLAMLINFLINPAFSLLPLVVTEHFGKGAYELGFINSAFGIGTILGGLILSAWGGFKNRILTTLAALTISGGAVFMVGVAPADGYLLALAGVALFGFLNPMVNGPLFAVMQAKVEPEIQGRVFSLLHAGAAFASPLGLAIAGPIADATNNQLWFVVGGILTLAAGLGSFFVRDIREIGAGIEEDEIIPSEGEGQLPKELEGAL
jgi:DHA3 family macrolide efflux protein-like MFS transporter